MKRRDLIAGFALAGMAPAAAQQEPESLYIPKAHLVDDRKFLHDFMDEYSFVDLVTALAGDPHHAYPGDPRPQRRHYGTIYGHISRQNPQSATFDGKHSGGHRVPRTAFVHFPDMVCEDGRGAYVEFRRGTCQRKAAPGRGEEATPRPACETDPEESRVANRRRTISASCRRRTRRD